MGEQPRRAGSVASQYTDPEAEHLRTDREQFNLAHKDTFKVLEGFPVSAAVHSAAPFPSDEDARLNALKSLGVLDTAHEQRFDDITDLVCSIFNVPIAIVSLVDKERQWFKSCVGLNCSQTDRKSSFCAWTLVPKNPEVLVVPDATEDVRYSSSVSCMSNQSCLGCHCLQLLISITNTTGWLADGCICTHSCCCHSFTQLFVVHVSPPRARYVQP